MYLNQTSSLLSEYAPEADLRKEFLPFKIQITEPTVPEYNSETGLLSEE